MGTRFSIQFGWTVLALILATVSMHTFRNQIRIPPTATLVGEIMDSMCATVGSHDAMMKRIGAKDARDCTLKCAKDGSFVLYDPVTKTVYQLNDQKKPEEFAGRVVKISGPYDQKSQTIEIESIELVSH